MSEGTAPMALAAFPASSGAEAELVERLKSNDQAAWARLFDDYYPVLYRYAFARLRSREEADDVAAQAFLQAFQAIGRFRYSGRPLLAWLYTITRRLVARQARRNRHPGARVDLSEAVSTAPEQTLVEHIGLLDEVARLGESQREVVILRFSLGLSMRETAAVVGKTEAAVHSLQVRAIENLRKRLER